MFFKILKLLIITFSITLCSNAFCNSSERCEALMDFCPECNYDEMIYYIKDWIYPYSLKEYLKTIEPIKNEVEKILIENNVSKYYVYLALAESGGDVNNVSNKQAKGLWQLMPFISKHYGLIVNKQIDERLDYIKSTKVAALYIKRNLKSFDNNALWGIAAYNAGGTNLKRKTSYTKNTSFLEVKKHSYPSYALAITVIKMIYISECSS